MNCNQEEFSLQTYTPLKTLYLQSKVRQEVVQVIVQHHV